MERNLAGLPRRVKVVSIVVFSGGATLESHGRCKRFAQWKVLPLGTTVLRPPYTDSANREAIQYMNL
jgi:hypothetical protein